MSVMQFGISETPARIVTVCASFKDYALGTC